MDIEVPNSPPQAGSNYSLSCTVSSDFSPTVKWLDPDNNEMDSSNAISKAFVDGNYTTTLVLNFDPLKTSHRGVYSCVSTILSVLHERKTVELEVSGKSIIASIYH